MKSIFRRTGGLLPLAQLLKSLLPSSANGRAEHPRREPGVIRLDPDAVAEAPIFRGPPATHTMRSGYMVLAPGASVARHSTRTNEEAIIVLAGEGALRIMDGPAIPLTAYSVAYCPPMTEHDVVNTGTDPLRYVWLVANAQVAAEAPRSQVRRRGRVPFFPQAVAPTREEKQHPVEEE